MAQYNEVTHSNSRAVSELPWFALHFTEYRQAREMSASHTCRKELQHVSGRMVLDRWSTPCNDEVMKTYWQNRAYTSEGEDMAPETPTCKRRREPPSRYRHLQSTQCPPARHPRSNRQVRC